MKIIKLKRIYLVILRLIYSLVMLLFLASCANIVPPEGGPRDQSPPVVIAAEPADRSVNFEERMIRIYFNEFVELKDIGNQLFVSPPLAEVPEVRIKGRSVVLELPDSLNTNTTYTIYFGEAVRDITEGNIVRDLTYSFSTGPVIDSMRMKGRLIDAFSGEAVKDGLICLYKGLEDSLFTGKRPDYITRSREDGSFRVYNLPDVDFRVYGLLDANSNYYYDLPNEAIAFDTSLHRPWVPPRLVIPDTVADSLMQLGADSLTILQTGKDSLEKVREEEEILLKLFTDLDTAQKLLSATVPNDRHIRLAFRHVVDEPQFSPLDTILTTPWFIREGERGDTLNLWLLEDAGDSLRMQISDGSRILDTAELQLKRKSAPSRSGRGKTTATPKKGVEIKANIRRVYNPALPLIFHCTYPVMLLDESRTMLMGAGDTLQPTFFSRGMEPRKFQLENELRSGEEYIIILDDSTITDLRGLPNDSVNFSFKTLGVDDVGELSLKLNGLEGNNWIAELLSGKGEMIRRKDSVGSEELMFPSLEAGKYKLRLFHDQNHNGRWDPGFFEARMQPEPVFYYPSEVTVRAKWSLEETWDIRKRQN